jgi:hypothetical protein
VGMLRFFRVLDEEIFEKTVKACPEAGKLYDACSKWLERDDH